MLTHLRRHEAHESVRRIARAMSAKFRKRYSIFAFAFAYGVLGGVEQIANAIHYHPLASLIVTLFGVRKTAGSFRGLFTKSKVILRRAKPIIFLGVFGYTMKTDFIEIANLLHDQPWQDGFIGTTVLFVECVYKFPHLCGAIARIARAVADKISRFAALAEQAGASADRILFADMDVSDK